MTARCVSAFPEPRSTRIRALLSLGMVLGVGTLSTMAAWGATATSTSGDFSAGTVNLVASSTGVTEAKNITIDLSSSAMSSTTAVTQSLTVKNTGSFGASLGITAQSPASDSAGFRCGAENLGISGQHILWIGVLRHCAKGRARAGRRWQYSCAPRKPDNAGRWGQQDSVRENDSGRRYSGRRKPPLYATQHRGNGGLNRYVTSQPPGHDQSLQASCSDHRRRPRSSVHRRHSTVIDIRHETRRLSIRLDVSRDTDGLVGICEIPTGIRAVGWRHCQCHHQRRRSTHSPRVRNRSAGQQSVVTDTQR